MHDTPPPLLNKLMPLDGPTTPKAATTNSGRELQHQQHTCRRKYKSRQRFKPMSFGHRTHKRFEYRQPIIIQQGKLLLPIIILLVTCAFLAISFIKCLDSPVKIAQQRYNKQQFAHTNSASTTSRESPQAVGSHLVETRVADLTNQEQLASDDANTNTNRMDRVRRTNNNNIIGERSPQTTSHNNNRQQQQQQQNDVCPSNRLLQSLLPIEYVGSPATSQRQHLSRAYCDCTVDPFGWHLTCFAGSASARNSATGGHSASGGASRQSSTNQEPLPNQLHPAFRAPQLQRQQQQRQAAVAGVSAAVVRRVHRSPARWMGDNDEPTSSGWTRSLNSSSNIDESLQPNESDPSSVHEGFGDEIIMTTVRPPDNMIPENQRKPARTNAGQHLLKKNQQNHATRQQQPDESTNNSVIADNDSFISLSSSLSTFTLMHQDANSNQHQQAQANNDRMNEKLTQLNSNNHLMFQTVPVLFSVKYMRNNMIEIDCDQAAPHYKPAMFQGFNVNEIGSFTFNNCQLPNIPFSVLLHRTRSSPPASVQVNNASDGQQSPPAATATGAGAVAVAAQLVDKQQPGGGGNRMTSQLLKPNRQRHQNLVRKRRQLNELEPEESSEDFARSSNPIVSLLSSSGESAAADEEPPGEAASGASGGVLQPPPNAGAQQQTSGHSTRPEPKVRSLTVNLNTVVDQRTLISLLTGLDLLEELQLNYMQLNLTNFEPDLDADFTGSLTTAAAEITTANMAQPPSSTIARQSNSFSSTLQAPSAGQQHRTSTPTTSTSTTSGQQAAPPPPSSSSPTTTSTTSTTTTSTTTAPPAQLLLATSASTPTMMGQQPPARATTLPPVPTTTTTSTAAVSTPTTTTTTSTTTTTTTGKPANNGGSSTRNRQQQTNQVLKPIQMGSSATRPSPTSLGTPRGLMIAQATGIPSTISIQTTTPQPTGSATLQPTGSSSSSSSSSLVAPSTVPSIALATVVNNLRQPAQTTASSQTSANSTNPGQRHQTPPPTTTTTLQQQPTTNNGNQISVGSSQTQSVSYTSSGGSSNPVARTTAQTARTNQPMFHLGSSSQPSSSSISVSSSTSSVSSPPSASTLINTSLQLSPNRIHHSPSAWFQASPGVQTTGGATLTTPANPPAGTRLIIGGPKQAQESSAQQQAGDQAISTSPSSLWSSLATSASASQSLNAPINTPYVSSLHSNGFGIRTSSSSSASLPVSLSLYNSNSGGGPTSNGFRTGSSGQQQQNVGLRNNMNTNQPQFAATTTTTSVNPQPTTNSQQQLNTQARRQQQQTGMPTTPTESTATNNQFVAAGGRLNQFNLNANANANAGGRRQQVVSLMTVQPAVMISNQRNQLSSTMSVAPSSEADFARESLDSNNNNGHLFSSSSATSPFSDNEFSDSELSSVSSSSSSMAPGTLQPGTRLRFKRNSESALEEFELSFGELLPNLRSLKLESFIDLSSRLGPKSAGDKSRPVVASGGGNRRFRRQFQPSDVPEKDEGHMSDSESEAIESSAGGTDSLIAEESSIHHNMVMANSRESQSAPSSPSPAAASRSPLKPIAKSSDDALSADEPGELLMRSASDHLSPDWSLPSDSANNNSGQDLGQEESDQTRQNNQQDQSGPNSARLRHFSLLLVRMFSKLSKLRILQLSSNDISYWPDNVLFDSRKSLNRLYLISNNIRQLGRNSFANLTHLEALDLSSNQLRQLNGDLFRDLSNLRNLRACRNLFRKLPSKLFSQIIQHQKSPLTTTTTITSTSTSNHNHHNLQHGRVANRLENVDFSKNRYLSQLSVDLFASSSRGQNLAPIISLNLSDCVFTDQLAGKSPEALFASLPDLVQVSLQSNRLRDILSTNGLFAKNNRLQRLDISHNQLIVLSSNLFNANASQISELQLHHNQLTQIPEQFLFNLRKLRKLSLAHNRLTQLNAKMFFTNQLIESIDLSHNQLVTLSTQQSSMIPFGNGANLRYLNLAHNNLSQFETDVFEIAWSFYTNLHVLDVSHNQFDGQISMPIFYTIADEMLLNLASNSIQSVSVEALMQHEQILDRYATYEAENVGSQGSNGMAEQDQYHKRNQQQAKVPTVNIRLTNNPIACDCMLEPLISYSRRVAAATNPSLVASIFPQQKSPNQPGDGSAVPPASSRYSVLNDPLASGDSTQAGAPRQPQLFYQFKFNDLYCAKPANLQRRLLSHISIGDLLCPIKDQRLCPRQCQCHYQSAFKTAIVDCNNRQLTRVPDQLTDSANFLHFQVESSFPTTGDNPLSQPQASSLNNSRSIASIDKVIIRLDNNRLTSMDQLAKLFTVVNSSPPPAQQASGESVYERSRFARAPQRQSAGQMVPESSTNNGVDNSGAAAAGLRDQPEAAPLVSSSPQDQLAAPGKRTMISPVVIGRNMHGGGSSSSSSSLRHRTRRDTMDAGSMPATGGDNGGGFDSLSGGNNNHLDVMDLTGTNNNGPGDNSNGQPQTMSTSVLESAEEFRNKRYHLTCELYLDHNMIDSISPFFLEILDQVKSSSMQSTLIPPQAALPTLMLEPPVHTKLNHLANAPDLLDPMRTSSSTPTSSAVVADPSDTGVADSEAGGRLSSQATPSGLFGRQPLAPEKKAALMETISHNVRLNQMQHQHHQHSDQQASNRHEGKVSVSPSLAVLSLRYNNLSNINAKMLHRLSKLIKSSNTKLYLGHNPFNCTDNYATPASASSSSSSGDPMHSSSSGGDSMEAPEMLPASPMGDQLIAASDSSSGAYLESTSDDLSPSASSTDSASTGGVHHLTAGALNQPLVPADCPVGQLKTWLTRHHSSIGDLDELYCVHMTPELAEKLRLVASNSSATGESTSERLKMQSTTSGAANTKWEHDHPWASSLMLSSMMSSGGNANHSAASQVEKNGVTWNSELLASTAKLIDVNMYDLCPYSGVQLDPSASGLLSAGHQQALISVAVVFIVISLCLLLMLVYFGDTQTILAFIYIHMNPIYSCLRLNESHLDGEKLYDAFVSYSSADRDIVMELLEKLEQQDQQSYSDGHQQTGGKNLTEKSHDTLVTEADLRPNPNANPNDNNNSSTLNRRTNSFQDLSTMSRSTSRIMIGDEFGGSAIAVNTSGGANAAAAGGRHSPGGKANANQHTPYRLCIHERDWLPGHLISWNILNSVQNSRRTILILSKDFIKSVWFQVEFHTAYYQMLEDKIDRLIVIVRGELPPKSEMDKNLAFLLTTKTYLTWGEKWFWERLHYALPHRSVPPALLKPAAEAKASAKHQHHHHYVPRQIGGANTTSVGGKQHTKSGDLTVSLSGTPPNGARQKPLIMSSIGKDCSNLLLPVHHHGGSNHGQPQAMIGSSSSSGSAASNTRSSSSSFLSGSSTGNLLSPTNQTTTTNDLLSTSTAPPPAATTRVTIGPSGGGGGGDESSGGQQHTSSTLLADSGRVTALNSSALIMTSPNSGPRQTNNSSAGVTSIMLDGSNTAGVGGGANSRFRAKKQERLQSFVDKAIANQLNLSEL